MKIKPRHPFRFGEAVFNEYGHCCFVETRNPSARLITVRNHDGTSSQWPWRRLKKGIHTV